MTRSFTAFGAGSANGDVQTQTPNVNPPFDHLAPHTPSPSQANSLQLSASPYSPAIAAFRGESPFFAQTNLDRGRERHHSVSSSSGGYDSQWGSRSQEEPRSRSASLYSLNNQFLSMGVPMDASSISEPPLQAIPAELQFPSSGLQDKGIGTDILMQQAHPRRLSSDGRRHPGRIATSNLFVETDPAQVGLPGNPHARAMTSSLSASAFTNSEMGSRSWPWDPSLASTLGLRHGSLSAPFPHAFPAIFNNYPTAGPPPFTNAISWTALPFEQGQHSPISPYMSPPPNWSGRHRSMSSSAIPGRPYNEASTYFAEDPSGSSLSLTIAPPSESDATDTTDASTGGSKRRRIKFKRSRTGCVMCRQRKVKCSQDGTPCKQCRVGKRECQYLETIPQRRRTTKLKGAEARTAKAGETSKARLESSSDPAVMPPDPPRQASDSGVVFSMPSSLHHLSPASQTHSLGSNDPSTDMWTHSPYYDSFSVSTPSSSSGSAAPNSIGASISPLGLGNHVPLQPVTTSVSAAEADQIATPLSDWGHNEIFLQPIMTQFPESIVQPELLPTEHASA